MLGFGKSLGVDIGDDALRVVELRAQGKGYRVVRAASVPLPEEQSPEALGAALASMLAGARARAAIALPASGCAFKSSLLPPAAPADLAQVLRFEAESQFPLPLAELTWGYALTPDPSGRMHAALVGARRMAVEERLAVLRQVGLSPAALQVAPLAAAQAIARPEGQYLLVLAGEEWSDLCLFDGNRLQGCRSVLAGSPSAEGWVERLAREMRPWMASTPVAQVVLLGAVTAAMGTALGRATGVPVVLGDPWADVTNAADCMHEMMEPPAAYATALGLAKSALARRPGINLFPPEMVAARIAQRKAAVTAAGLAVVAMLFVPVLLMNGEALRERRAEYTRVTARAAAARPKTADVPGVALTAAQQAAAALVKPESNPLVMLRELSARLPEDVLLTDFSFDRGRTAVLKGRVPTNEKLATAMKAIAAMGVVERAMLDYANLVTDKEAQSYDFQVTCTLPATTDPTSAPVRGRTGTKTPGGTTRVQ